MIHPKTPERRRASHDAAGQFGTASASAACFSSTSKASFIVRESPDDISLSLLDQPLLALRAGSASGGQKHLFRKSSCLSCVSYPNSLFPEVARILFGTLLADDTIKD